MLIFKAKTAVNSIFLVGSILISTLALASTEASNIGAMADTMTDSFSNIGALFIAAAYIAGFALTVAAIFKFKAHKDNPQQVPLGTAIALLVIGVLLVFLPALFKPAGSTLFGGTPQAAGSKGENAELPGESGP